MNDKSKNSKEKHATDSVAETANVNAGANDTEAKAEATSTEATAETTGTETASETAPSTEETATETVAETAKPVENEKIRTIAASIVAIVEARNGTNLPKLSAKDILATITPEQSAGITIDVHMDEDDHAKGYFNFTEFGVTYRIPSSGSIEFGIDYSAPAK